MVTRGAVGEAEHPGPGADVPTPLGDQGAAAGPVLNCAAPVEATGLTKSYGFRVAVDDVSLRVGSGVTGLLGPNGAGKTTLLRCLAGLIGWNSGEVRVCGIDLAHRPSEARRKIGFMPERVAFPTEMRVVDYLRFVSEMKGIARRERSNAIETALTRAGLEKVRSRIAGNLSKGYRQRVGLAVTLLGDPPVLILDEPSAGLDPLSVMEFRDVIRRCSEDRTVLVSTHVLPEARFLCDRVILMSSGRVAYDGPTAGMIAAGPTRLTMRIRVHQRSSEDDQPTPEVPGARIVQCHRGRGEYVMVVDATSERATASLVAELCAGGWLVVGVEPTVDVLEGAFRSAIPDAGLHDREPMS